MLEVGGNVVRLTGLYHANRGPHSFFFKKGEIGKRGDSVLNLIHYEDAASIAVAVRPSPWRSSHVFHRPWNDWVYTLS